MGKRIYSCSYHRLYQVTAYFHRPIANQLANAPVRFPLLFVRKYAVALSVEFLSIDTVNVWMFAFGYIGVANTE